MSFCYIGEEGERKQLEYTSFDGRKIACFLWDKVKEPKGIIQIIHGMTSHMKRYNELAKVLNSYGYVVLGDDHRPNGESAGLANLGKASKNNFRENVLDEIGITKSLKQRCNLPIMLFAHSYGSFLAQTYIEEAGELVNGVILSGSSIMSTTKLAFGKLLTWLQSAIYKMDEPNLMMYNMTFGANNKAFEQDGIDNAWLNRDLIKVKEYNDDPYCNFYMSHGFYYSMMRGLYNTYQKSSLAQIRKDLPIFIISGSLDPLGGSGKKIIKLHNTYKQHNLNVTMKLYKDARHELTSDTEKEIVIKDMVDFFNSCI